MLILAGCAGRSIEDLKNEGSPKILHSLFSVHQISDCLVANVFPKAKVQTINKGKRIINDSLLGVQQVVELRDDGQGTDIRYWLTDNHNPTNDSLKGVINCARSR